MPKTPRRAPLAHHLIVPERSGAAFANSVILLSPIGTLSCTITNVRGSMPVAWRMARDVAAMRRWTRLPASSARHGLCRVHGARAPRAGPDTVSAAQRWAGKGGTHGAADPRRGEYLPPARRRHRDFHARPPDRSVRDRHGHHRPHRRHYGPRLVLRLSAPGPLGH